MMPVEELHVEWGHCMGSAVLSHAKRRGRLCTGNAFRHKWFEARDNGSASFT